MMIKKEHFWFYAIRWFILVIFLIKHISCGNVYKLNEDNVDNIFYGRWMIKFYADWCPACRDLTYPWDQLEKEADNLDINIGSINIERHPELSGRFYVTSLPTIYYIENGVFRNAKYLNTADKLIDFVKNKEYIKIDPLPVWRSPKSFQMRLLGKFYKFSLRIKDLHTKMVDVYKIPVWASYLIFLVATILIGASMGMGLVFVMDFYGSLRKSDSYMEDENIIQQVRKEKLHHNGQGDDHEKED